jgi:hypothetical protein
MALVYVARPDPGSSTGLSSQGLNQKNVYLTLDVQGTTGAGHAQVRAMPGIDEIIVDVRGLPANSKFTAYATNGQQTVALLTSTSNAMGAMAETMAFVHFFANNFNKIIIKPAES